MSSADSVSSLVMTTNLPSNFSAALTLVTSSRESMQNYGVCSDLDRFWAHVTRVGWWRSWCSVMNPIVLHALLACRRVHHHAIGMFIVTDADAAAIRAVFDQEGELSA